MVNQFKGELNINPPIYFTILYDGRCVKVGREDFEEWKGFMRWVGETQLFDAIKIGVEQHKKLNVDYYIVRAEGVGELSIKTTRVVNQPEDLPIEVLQLFFANSPWYKQNTGKSIQKLLV